MLYRRSWARGGTYFFTVNLARRERSLLIDYIDVLRETVARVKKQHPFEIDAMVVLPEHLHAVWTLPTGDAEYPQRWMLIKAGFSRNIPEGEYQGNSRMSKGERGIWQRRYWEHRIRDEKDFAHHVDYIHFNPVKHGYVPCASDWPYSSIHRYIREGIVAPDWGGRVCTGDNAGYGERR